MKFIVTFLMGALLGAGSLFLYLRQVGASEPQPAVVVAPLAGTVAMPGTAAAGAVIAPGSLPPAPVVPMDLSEADLPLRPVQTGSEASTGTPPVPEAANAKLLIPVEGIKLAQLSDNFDQPRGSERHHEALDIMAPKGSKVLAVADGKVAKLFDSKAGGLTVYQFDPSEKLAYYYAHLDKYADGIKEGDAVKRGDLIGYVGTTGNANPNGPHLHFAVFALTPEKQWWKGSPLNPFPMMAE